MLARTDFNEYTSRREVGAVFTSSWTASGQNWNLREQFFLERSSASSYHPYGQLRARNLSEIGFFGDLTYILVNLLHFMCRLGATERDLSCLRLGFLESLGGFDGLTGILSLRYTCVGLLDNGFFGARLSRRGLYTCEDECTGCQVPFP